MFLNVLKGPYLTTHQVDRVLALSASETGSVERGTLLYADESNEFRIADAAQAGTDTAPGAMLYLSLQVGDDMTAMMANGYPVSAESVPKLGGLSLAQTMEIETDMYDGDIAVNDALSVEGGKFVPHATAATGATVYGYCTKAPHSRTTNNGVVVPNYKHGGSSVTVINVATARDTQVANA